MNGPEEQDQHLAHLAITTLAHNWRADHTVPARSLYPHQWSWDTGFIAIGLRHAAPERAWHDLRTLLDAQWSDGRVPHIVFDEEALAGNGGPRYFPGPAFWRTHTAAPAPIRPTSGIVQPPVHALAAWEIYRCARDATSRTFAASELTRLYPKLVAQQHYLMRCRDICGTGLAAVVHPWETGQDNSPSWDQPLAAVPADLALVERHRRPDLAVSVASHRPTNTDYARYIAIAQGYRSYGYVDDGPGGRYLFLAECPSFNTLLAAAEYALAQIAEVIGCDPRPHRQQGRRLTERLVEHLFRPETGMFHARDLYTGQHSPARTIAGLLPLLLPELPRPVVESLVAEARSDRFGLGESMKLPLPSYDRTVADFDPVRYWRGPIWINMNWLLWRGLQQHGYHTLAATLRDAMIELVRESGCFEYFHALTGEGVGASEFSWTAALVLDLLATSGRVEPAELAVGSR